MKKHLSILNWGTHMLSAIGYAGLSIGLSSCETGASDPHANLGYDEVYSTTRDEAGLPPVNDGMGVDEDVAPSSRGRARLAASVPVNGPSSAGAGDMVRVVAHGRKPVPQFPEWSDWEPAFNNDPSILVRYQREGSKANCWSNPPHAMESGKGSTGYRYGVEIQNKTGNQSILWQKVFVNGDEDEGGGSYWDWRSVCVIPPYGTNYNSFADARWDLW